MPLHLIKLSVGATSLDDLQRWQTQRAAAQPPLRHTTRNFPRRADEILAGGSIYWVINRFVTARQRIADIVEGDRGAGSKGTDLILHPQLVPVRPRLIKPFQGWRYLKPDDAPEDADSGFHEMALPEALRRELVALALI